MNEIERKVREAVRDALLTYGYTDFVMRVDDNPDDPADMNIEYGAVLVVLRGSGRAEKIHHMEQIVKAAADGFVS